MIALSAPIDQNYSKLNYTAMKHFNLLKTTLLLCALIVGSLSGWATDVTFTFNTYAGIAELGIAKPDKGAASNLSTEPYSKSGVMYYPRKS